MKTKTVLKARTPKAIKRLWYSTVSMMLCVVISLLSLVGCSSEENEEINFFEDDLSKYVYISEEDYKSFPVNDVFYEVGDFDVNEKIVKLLYKNRDKNPLYDGKYYRNKTISTGDEVYIFYRGYYLDENGKEIDFDGGCNFFSNVYPLGIGSGGFVSGFESGLIGILPEEYPVLDLIDTGNVEEGDVVYLSYTVISPDKNGSKTSERIDLSRDDIDEIYGTGFKEFLLGGADGASPIKVGEGILGTKIFPVHNGSATYYNMQVTAVSRCEDNPITIDVRFPMSYPQSEELAGRWVKFDVYVEKVQYYSVPEYNDAFVTDVLKISEETFSGKEGNGPAEKYKQVLLDEARAEYEETKISIMEEAFWDNVNAKLEVKELPKTLIDEFYNEYYSELVAQHEYYKDYYPDLESFGQAYFGINDVTVTVDEYMKGRAEDAAKEKLAFYYIAREENLLPSSEELAPRYDEVVEEYLLGYLEGAYKTDYQKCKTEEERKKYRDDLRADMISNYGKEYFEEIVYYEIMIEEMAQYAVLIKK